jgi:hypothetical protein
VDPFAPRPKPERVPRSSVVMSKLIPGCSRYWNGPGPLACGRGACPRNGLPRAQIRTKSSCAWNRFTNFLVLARAAFSPNSAAVAGESPPTLASLSRSVLPLRLTADWEPASSGRLPRASANIAADRFHLDELLHQLNDVLSLTFVDLTRTS